MTQFRGYGKGENQMNDQMKASKQLEKFTEVCEGVLSNIQGGGKGSIFALIFSSFHGKK